MCSSIRSCTVLKTLPKAVTQPGSCTLRLCTMFKTLSRAVPSLKLLRTLKSHSRQFQKWDDVVIGVYKKRTFVRLCPDLVESVSVVRSEDMSTVEDNVTVSGSFFTDIPTQKYVAEHNNRKRPVLGVPRGAYQTSAFGTVFQDGSQIYSQIAARVENKQPIYAPQLFCIRL